MKRKIKQRGTPVMIDGEEHRVKFGMEAMFYLSEHYGTFNKAIAEFQKFDANAINRDGLEAFCRMLAAGLAHEKEELQYEFDDLVNVIGFENLIELANSIVTELNRSMPEKKEEPENPT